MGGTLTVERPSDVDGTLPEVLAAQVLAPDRRRFPAHPL